MKKSRWYKSGDELLKEIDISHAQNGALLWFLGQLGFVIKMGGTIVYIDALLNDFSSGKTGAGRLYDPPFTTLRGVNADYFVCTHNHGDHLNLDTILPQARANPKTRFIVPMPWRGLLTGAGVEEARVIGAREGREIALSPGISLFPVAASHPQYETDKNGDHTCLGYVARGEGATVYHAGDTFVTERLVKSLEGLKPIDVAILPINGGDWERAAGGIVGNMGIRDAVKLVQKLEADLAVPAHYDMMDNNSANPAHFADDMYRFCPWQKYHVFALGEKFAYYR